MNTSKIYSSDTGVQFEGIFSQFFNNQIGLINYLGFQVFMMFMIL